MVPVAIMPVHGAVTPVAVPFILNGNVLVLGFNIGMLPVVAAPASAVLTIPLGIIIMIAAAAIIPALTSVLAVCNSNSIVPAAVPVPLATIIIVGLIGPNAAVVTGPILILVRAR